MKVGIKNPNFLS